MLHLDLSNKEIFNEAYLHTYSIQDRFLLLFGSAGSGKSYWALMKVLIRLLSEKSHRFLFVRKVAKTIRESQFKLAQDIINQWGIRHKFEIRESDMRIRCSNGNEILTVGLDDPEKIKSIQRITGIWIEELTELTEQDLNQLNLRLRGFTQNYKQIIGTYNPINIYHWINEVFHKRQRDDTYILKTTYKDNKFIDEEYKKQLEGYKQYNEEYHRIYALGEWGLLTGLIFKNWDLIDKFPEEVDDLFYGLDFGFNNPSALVKIGLKDKVPYLEELLYETELTNKVLIEKCKQLIPEELRRKKSLYCDCAEPNRIQEFNDAGFYAIPCIKGKESVKNSIDYVKSCGPLQVTKKSINLKKELQSYCWKESKDGQLLEEPVPFNDHLIAGVRYGLYTNKSTQRPRARML